MNDILSQDEIDALLNAVGDDDEGSSDSAVETEESLETFEDVEPDSEHTLPSDEMHKTITKYDFRRPEVISKDQIRTLQMIHKTFSRSLTNAFSSHLRTTVEVNLMAVDQLTYGEFNMSLSNPTCLNTFSMEPLEGLAVFEINPLVVFVMIERLLGGVGESPDEIRALTDIELAIFEKVTLMSLEALSAAWGHVQDFKVEKKDTEANPQFVQIVAPGETVILITLEVKMGPTSGIISLCYPFIMLEPLVSKLSAQQWISSSKKGDDNYQQAISDSLKMTKLDVAAELGSVSLSVRDIINLKKGDVVSLNRKAKDDIAIKVKGKYKFFAQPGIIGRYKVVKLTNPIKKDTVV